MKGGRSGQLKQQGPETVLRHTQTESPRHQDPLISAGVSYFSLLSALSALTQEALLMSSQGWRGGKEQYTIITTSDQWQKWQGNKDYQSFIKGLLYPTFSTPPVTTVELRDTRAQLWLGRMLEPLLSAFGFIFGSGWNDIVGLSELVDD